MTLRRLLLRSCALNRSFHPIIRPQWAPRTAIPTYRRQFHQSPATLAPRQVNAKLREEADGVRLYDETEDGPTQFTQQGDMDISPADEIRIQAWQEQFGISDEMLAYLVTRYPGIEQRHIEDIKSGKLKEAQLPKLLYPDGKVPKSVPGFQDLGEGVTVEEKELARQLVEGDRSAEDRQARAIAKVMAEDERFERLFLKGLSESERKEFEEMRSDPELRELLKGLNKDYEEEEEEDIDDEDEGRDDERGQGGDGGEKRLTKPTKRTKSGFNDFLAPVGGVPEGLEGLMKEFENHPDLKRIADTWKGFQEDENAGEHDPDMKELDDMLADLERKGGDDEGVQILETLKKLGKFGQTDSLLSDDDSGAQEELEKIAAQLGLDPDDRSPAKGEEDSDFEDFEKEQEEMKRKIREEEQDTLSRFSKIREKPGFWNYEDPGAGEDEVFQGDDLSSMGHGELEQHREIREYARYAAWELPLLSKLAKPFELPPETMPLRFRYTTYFGEQHPAGRKVVLKFAPKDLQKLANLTDAQVTKMIKICGVRYNPETELVKMSCDRFETQAQNKRYLGDLVDKLIVEAKDASDMFEDVPIDTRHHKKKPWYQFPEKWLLTPERKKEIEENRRLRSEQEERREIEGTVVDGLGIIAQALRGGQNEAQPVMVGAGSRRGRLT